MTNPQTWFCRNRYKNSHLNRQIYRCELFLFMQLLVSTQFLYRTAVKATFNVKENIKDNIKNSIALTINITTSPTKIRKNWWQNHICLSSHFLLQLFYNIIFILSIIFINFHYFLLIKFRAINYQLSLLFFFKSFE